MKHSGILCAILVVALQVQVEAKMEIISDISSSEDWKYLGKFCYKEKGGKFLLDIDASLEQRSQTFCFYSDWAGQWPITYGNREIMGCREKESKAARCVNITQLYHWFDGKYDLDIKSKIPRWWFVTLSNCANEIGKGGGSPVNLDEVKILYLNPGTSKFENQFSKDLHGVPEMSIVFLCCFFVLCGMLAQAKVVAKEKQLSYDILKLLAISVGFATVAMGMKVIHFIVFAENGQGLSGLNVLSFVLEGVAQMVLIGCMIDLSQGYTISTNFVASRRGTYMVLSIYMFLHIFLLVYDFELADQASVLYIYESPPGYALIVLRMFILANIVKNIHETFTFEKKASRRLFYKTLGAFNVVWFIATPFAVTIAHFQPSYTRAGVLFCMWGVFDIMSYFLFFLIFRPWDGNRFIKVLNPMASVAFGNNNMQVFPEAERSFDDPMGNINQNFDHGVVDQGSFDTTKPGE